MCVYFCIDSIAILPTKIFIITPSVIPTSMTSDTTMGAKGPGRHIVHPGQDVELLCTFNDLLNNILVAGWEINHRLYGKNALVGGQLHGYKGKVDNANIIVENIMMNDSRNGTEHRCVLFNNGTRSNESDPIILYVVGKYQYNMYTVIFNSNYVLLLLLRKYL